MAHKKKSQRRPWWKSSGFSKNSKSKTKISSNDTSNQSESARSRALHVLADLREDPSLSLTEAAKNRGVKLREVYKYAGSALHKLPSGRVHVRPNDTLRETIWIVNKKGTDTPVPTKNNRERSLLGVWQNAIQAAGNGDFSQIRTFPKNTFVGGIRLATGDYEVQRILEANEGRKEPFEGLYRTLTRPS